MQRHLNQLCTNASSSISDTAVNTSKCSPERIFPTLTILPLPHFKLHSSNQMAEPAVLPSCPQVLFCTLTSEQRELYKSYLASKDLAEIFEGRRTALAGIDILRKICNHPDLLERAKWEAEQVGQRQGTSKHVGQVGS